MYNKTVSSKDTYLYILSLRTLLSGQPVNIYQIPTTLYKGFLGKICYQLTILSLEDYRKEYYYDSIV